MATLTHKGCFKIDGIEFEAKAISQTNESLATASSGRSIDGTMHITWARPLVRKWEIEMPPCTALEANEILSRVLSKTYYLTIFDSALNSEEEVHCYTSNSKSECYSGVILDGLYIGITFSAIEV